jgi:hypothetical protein
MPRIHGLADPSEKKNQENCMVRHEAAEALGAIGMILPKKRELEKNDRTRIMIIYIYIHNYLILFSTEKLTSPKSLQK